PRPDIRLPPRPRRPQLVDRDPGHHRRQPRPEGVRLLLQARVAQPGLLHRVLGLPDRAEDPVGDGEQPRPQLLELPRVRHGSSPPGHPAATRRCPYDETAAPSVTWPTRGPEDVTGAGAVSSLGATPTTGVGGKETPTMDTALWILTWVLAAGYLAGALAMLFMPKETFRSISGGQHYAGAFRWGPPSGRG